MARLSIIVCDLCKKMAESTNHKLQIASGRGDGKVAQKAEICQACFDDLKRRLDSSVSLNNITQPRAAAPSDGPITPIASRRRPPTDGCTHSNSKFDSPFVICLDCGDKQKI